MRVFPDWCCSRLALTSLLTVGGLAAQTSIVQANFQSKSEMVLVPVTVTDHYGKTVTGLQPQDFAVFDERTPRQIISLNSEDAPCSVGLVLDVSGSMRNAIGIAKEVAHAFVNTANPQDEFLFLTVATQPDTISGFTTDIKSLEQEIDLTRSGGLTALIDTVYLGLTHMHQARQSRRALLVLSDGMDNHSRYSKSKLLRVAMESDVQIYTIILDNGLTGGQAAGLPFRPSMAKKPWDRAQEQQGPRLLEELAEKTGGLHFHVRTEAEAKEAAVKAGLALRNEYVIGYRPPESDSTGKWRRIHVKLQVPDVHASARDGYYSR